jgi:ERCC4-type nuclease
MSHTITLDEREHALYEKCILIQNDDKHPYHMASLAVSKQVLPLADASIRVGSDEWLVERKSLSDLLASIKDGRYDEQSYRLQHTVDCHRVIYVIEGVLSTLKLPRERKLVHATMTSLQVFKGFAVVRTASVQETAEWLLATADKIHRDMTVKKKVPLGSSSSSSPPPVAGAYSTVVKRVKKENVTPENIGEIFLCQLPGVSHVAATAICRVYPSLVQLMDALRADPECLQSLTTTDASGKSRKLGKNVHTAIAEYLMATPVTPPPVTPEKKASTSVELGWQGPPLDRPEDASTEA